VGVFPLMDRDGLGERAREVAADLRAAGLSVAYDDSGAIGRRYRRQDEVGTPFCVTVDYATLGEAEEGDSEGQNGGTEDGDAPDPDTVTLRERDSTAQTRVAIADLPRVLSGLRDGDLTFDEI